MIAKLLVIAMLLAMPVYAAPTLSNNTPVNGSYFGRGSVNFYVNVTYASLNYVRLFLISEDAYMNGEPWDTYDMSCVSTNCTKSVSFSIAGADTLEFFYFEANDSTGIARLGNATHPLQFKIDRSPPVITFVRPVNGSFVSGNVTVEVTATDTISGVNTSAFRLSLDNSTWMGMSNGLGYFNSSYPNNQTLTVYVLAADKLNNSGTSAINVTVDNELPRLLVTSHSNGMIIAGTVSFTLNVSDSLSGLNSSGAKIKIASSETAMSCSGNKSAVCNISVSTVLYPDNDYNITFTATDVAGNSNSTNLSVTINNNKPSVSLSPEGYAKGTVAVSASLSNPGSMITGVKLKVERSGYSNNVTMSCNQQYTSCSYSLETASLGDGTYTLTANATNTLNQPATDTATITADNVLPVINITGPSSPVSNIFTISASVTDANYDRTRVTYSIVGSGTMSCVVASSTTLLCESQYDPAALSNGDYNLVVTALDLSGNSATGSRTITVSKSGSSSGSGSSESGTSGSGSGSAGSSGNSGVANGTGSGNIICGDNVCSLIEDCRLCPADCGKCKYGEGGTGGSDGNGGGGNPILNLFGSGEGGISATISSNPLLIGLIGIILVAAGVAIKLLRKKGPKTEKPKNPKKEKYKAEPFIFGNSK